MNPTTRTDTKISHDAEYQRWRSPLEGILGIPFSARNRVDVLHNGDEIFPAMLEAIAQARQRIDFLTYVYWSGAIAQRFAQTLADQAQAGVTVNVLLDSFGAKEMSQEHIELMRAAGVNVQWFRPLAKWRLWQTDNRTHRKVLIVDGKLGFTGGVGIAQEWEGNARNPTEWRDTHFRIQGPAVYALQGAFLGNWAETGQPIHKAGDIMQMLEPQGDVWIQLIRTTASIGWSDIATLLRLLIVEAHHHLRITTAYFVPDEDTLEVLCAAATRGVTVEVMMPGPHSDARISQLAGEDEFRRLLDAGVKLWSYQKTMLHTKVITVDGLLACVGSANFNQRSMRKDDEISVVMLSREITALLDQHFTEDQTACKPIRPGDWRKRGWLQRLLESVSRLIKPQV